MKMPTIIEGHSSSSGRSNSLTDADDDDALSGQYNRDCRGREKSNDDDDDAQERKSFAGCGRCTLFFIKLSHTHTHNRVRPNESALFGLNVQPALYTHPPP